MGIRAAVLPVRVQSVIRVVGNCRQSRQSHHQLLLELPPRSRQSRRRNRPRPRPRLHRHLLLENPLMSCQRSLINQLSL